MHATRAAASGVLAVGAGLAVGELAAGLLPEVPSLVVAVGQGVIQVAPPAVEDFAISVFGVYDKLALIVGTVLLSLGLGALLGLARPPVPWLGLAAFGTVGAVSALDSPGAPAEGAVLSGAAATGVSMLTLALLRRRAEAPERRAFLLAAGSAAAACVGAAAVGRWLAERHRASFYARDAAALPATAPAPPPAASFSVPGLSPVVTPNDEFYRVDTALVVPHVDPSVWRLRLTGLVDRPLELDYDDLRSMATEERYVTLACVSNNVGGRLVGNALWYGVPLEDLLRRAGVRREGTQVVGRSVEDFTTGFPTSVAFDGRGAMVALGMNGEPLPYDHGFPARLVVPGLYGFVSACKWLQEIELAGWESFDAYWVPRGWAKEAPVKTQSRIDVPREGRMLSPGRQPVAGVAWAPGRGITRVQVRVDEGEWQDADLAEELSDDAWRLWKLDWEATPGEHRLEVRAADSSGEFQTAEFHRPRPDGATGHHRVRVRVGG